MNGTAFSCKDGMLVQDRVGVDRGTVRDGAGGKDVGTRPNACMMRQARADIRDGKSGAVLRALELLLGHDRGVMCRLEVIGR